MSATSSSPSDQKARASGLSRRSFVNASAAAGAAFHIMSPQTVRGSQANSKITVGLIGAGGRGTYDATLVQTDPRAQLVALCDRFPDRLEESNARLKLQNPATYTDYTKLLASNVDAVIIATPPFEHPEQLESAVAAGKHVYCEKPMGVDVEGCKRVIDAGRKARKDQVISVGFQQRYGDVYLEAYKRMKEGQIGDLLTARGYWIANDPFTRRPYDDPQIERVRNWFCYREYSGDFIVEQDCHNFDVLHWFLGGLPEAAVGRGGTKIRTNMDLMDHLSLVFTWPNGTHVNFEANQLTPRGFNRIGEEFTGSKGTLHTSRQKMVHLKGPNDAEEMLSKRDITMDAFDHFFTMIQTGKAENVAERSALSTMIAILGREALYTGREITWRGLYGVYA
ncbi:MAG: Gfo/Idh/MocA family oxidoreductase [Bryobacterales bacterium]|nr:Gfo/Idh/MocA family oxidoreductase [Bryobacterales bacterium]